MLAAQDRFLDVVLTADFGCRFGTAQHRRTAAALNSSVWVLRLAIVFSFFCTRVLLYHVSNPWGPFQIYVRPAKVIPYPTNY